MLGTLHTYDIQIQIPQVWKREAAVGTWESGRRGGTWESGRRGGSGHLGER